MRIGFTGAHRTGKTTLARVVSRIYQLPMLTNRVSQVVADYGFDMATDNRLETGVRMQAEQLAVMLDHIEATRFATPLERQVERGVSYVSDRTPLDAAAYFMADATASSGTELARETCVAYVEKCLALTAKHFDVVILVPPGIDVQPTAGKPPVNPAYQEHIHFLVQGFLFDDQVEIRKGQVRRENVDRYNRFAAVLDYLDPIARELGVAVPAERDVAA